VRPGGRVVASIKIIHTGRGHPNHTTLHHRAAIQKAASTQTPDCEPENNRRRENLEPDCEERHTRARGPRSACPL
jgi:hypothetical protein